MGDVVRIRRPQDVSMGDYVTDESRLAEVVLTEPFGFTLIDSVTGEEFVLSLAEARRWRVVRREREGDRGAA